MVSFHPDWIFSPSGTLAVVTYGPDRRPSGLSVLWPGCEPHHDRNARVADHPMPA